MRIDEDIYLIEKDRQERAGMPKCRCSNCEAEACKILSTRGKWLTVSNFDAGLANPESLEGLGSGRREDDDPDFRPEVFNDPDASIVNQKNKGPPGRRIELIALAELLTRTFENHHEQLMNGEDRLKASDYLDEDDIWRILNKIYLIRTQADVLDILGCDILPGGVVKLFDCIANWRADSVGVEAMERLRARESATRLIQAETLIRLQKQYDERALKALEEQTQKANKRKQIESNRLAGSAAKRQRKETIENKRRAKEEFKIKKKADRPKNARMMEALRAGKTM